MKTPYTFLTLRYVHDVAAGESLNVGVVLHARKSNFIGARIQTKFGRLKKAFPRLEGEDHRKLMRFLQSRFDTLQMRETDELRFSRKPVDVCSLATGILPNDDSSLQWSTVGGGLTSDPAAELEHLYQRLVLLNDPAQPNKGRDDDEVWSQFRAPLLREKVLTYLAPHRVVAQNDEMEFEHAWKNHRWHCLMPLSFDLIDPDSIKDKAHRLLGQMIGVSDKLTEHILYLMVGEPQHEKCRTAANRALNLLHNSMPLKPEIVRENEADSFSRDFADRIKRHSA